MPDNQSFKSFIRDVWQTLLAIETPVEGVRLVLDKEPFEDVFYEKIRCFLVHEGSVSDEVMFDTSKMVDGKLTAQFKVGSPNVFPDFWCMNLAQAIREAPENQDEFAAAI